MSDGFADWQAAQWSPSENRPPPAWLHTPLAKEIYRQQCGREAGDWVASLQAKELGRLRKENRQLSDRLNRVEKWFKPTANGDELLFTVVNKALHAFKDNIEAKQRATITKSDPVADLEQRVRQLEERPSLEYRGVWQADQDYPANSAITHQGSVWISRIQTKGCRPGTGDAAWILAVKRGQDAKPPRDPVVR